MSLVLNEYTGDGVTTTFNFSMVGGYLSRDFVAFLTRPNDKLLEYSPYTGTVTWLSDFSVRVSDPIPVGTTFVITRRTAATALVDFQNTSRITERNLDTAFGQSLHRTVELEDVTARRVEASARLAEEAVVAAQGAAESAATSATSAATAVSLVAAANAAAVESAMFAQEAASQAEAATDTADEALALIQQAVKGNVDSFNGRDGVVLPERGDYTPAMVGFEAAGVLVPVADFSPVPAWSDPVLNAQAQSLANRTEIIKSAVLYYPDYAAASTAAATLPDGQLVDAMVNETTMHYVVAAGALVQIPEREGDGPLNVRKFITSPIDGTTSNQSGIVAAVAAASASGADLYWPRGTYVSDANIQNFWNVNHIGPGVIKRGSNTWFITPRVSTHTNEMFCSPTAGLGSNDGLTADFPCSVAATFTSRLRLLGDKAAKGQWRIRWLGAGEANGVTLTGLPYFGQALQIWGEDAPDYGELPSKWDGTSAAASYAFRTNHGNTALAFDFRNIEFINWRKDVGNSGAITNDDRMRAEVWNCKFTNTDVGIWVLQSYIRVRKSTFTNCRTWGVNVSYLSYGNIGLTGADNGNRFYECGTSVSVARNSVAYVQNNDVYTIVDRAIEVNKQSRVRSLENRFHSWSTTPSSLRSVYYATEGGLFNNDNNSGSPDVFNLPISGASPVYRGSVNSTHSQLHAFGPLCLHARNNVALIYSDNTRTLVPGASPLRIPGYTLYSPSFKLVFEVLLSVSGGKSFGIDIAGVGSATALRIAFADLPAPASTTALLVRMTVTKTEGANMVFDVECPALNYYSYNNDVEGALAQTGVREPSEVLKIFRLYVTPGTQGGIVIVRRLESWIQI